MKILRLAFASVVYAVAMAAPALAWDGVNIDTGDTITIAEGVKIAEGNSIAFADDKGQPHTVTIASITQTEDAIELVLIDDTSGDSQTYDFDPADAPADIELPDPAQ